MTRVVVADDQPVVLEGFAAILGAAADLEVVGTAPDGVELVDLVTRTRPDVAVVDVRMPQLDGIAATRRIRDAHPATHVLMLTTFDLEEYVADALQAGASGFLLKDVPAARLVEGVRLVAAGALLLGPRVARRLAADGPRRPVPGLDRVTAREREVLAAVAQGLSNAEVAARLGIGEQTVKTHVSELLRKLGRRDRAQLVVAAYEGGVVTPG
ncbi:two component transcriptional regulator, LuxR family [Cellulomonas flavigena DSM 20109]|uniref:Two component transcriptional regulator, LuxR family n=1 Tax=Cellulomonas flavigena (strain ATCC 482 / DSM 20109 / BCRC 11376 / JCM 18109 / NBRC 3775 / NCIMB 8073 / NRS 134) TaxID=446466 RepID=D5UIR1_CELFN|nr:response regulator transcription factor [Cellulomonas flavigena]ADG73560.1 two component transcriptional regulator, LuxR family [Cellulomonas flavigena DSM 20109]